MLKVNVSQNSNKKLFQILLFILFSFFTQNSRAQCTGPANDCDNDGVVNSQDLDDDNDGILDTDEGYAPCTNFIGNPSFESEALDTVSDHDGFASTYTGNTFWFDGVGTAGAYYRGAGGSGITPPLTAFNGDRYIGFHEGGDPGDCCPNEAFANTLQNPITSGNSYSLNFAGSSYDPYNPGFGSTTGKLVIYGVNDSS